jgi:hypothetical protein
VAGRSEWAGLGNSWGHLHHGRSMHARRSWWAWWAAVTGGCSARFHGLLGKTRTGDDTLLRSVHAEAESPAIIVLVKHADQLPGAELELVGHGGLEVELHAMNVVWPWTWTVGRSSDGHG